MEAESTPETVAQETIHRLQLSKHPDMQVIDAEHTAFYVEYDPHATKFDGIWYISQYLPL